MHVMTAVRDGTATGAVVVDGRPFGLLIDGVERPAVSGRTFPSSDPATGEVVGWFAEAGPEDVDAAVAAARRAFEGPWRRVSATERGRILQRTAHAVTAHRELLARLETRDCGKPLAQARQDLDIAARYLELFGNAAQSLQGHQIPVGHEVFDFTVREPFGVSAQINAWNFPINMAARSIGAALAAGNTVVVKTPELAPLTTALLGRLLTGAGLPPGVVNIVHGSGAVAGAALAGHPGVDLVTFTGSTGTGRKVAGAAAQQLTPTVMELGGKSPVVVFADADLDAVTRQLASGFVEANGQSCDLPSLLLVQHEVAGPVLDALARRVGRFTLGPGLGDPDVAALVSEDQRARVAGYVDTAVREGARVVIGGRAPADPHLAGGWFYEPTVLADVRPGSTVAREEIFGPVLAVMEFRDEAEAIELANASDYGLAAFVWTNDARRSLRVARDIRAGQVFVNCFTSGDNPLLPFGGFKDSGYGREKGVEALLTYSQTKNICLRAEEDHDDEG